MVKYTPGRYTATTVLPSASRHLVSRFSYGVTPALVAEVNAAGGARAWWEQQIATAYDDPDAIAAEADWWPNQHYDALTIWKRQQAGTEGSWEVMSDYSRRLVARRIISPRQVLEVMTEFFEAHFHVPTTADNPPFWRVPYGDVIRAGALGRFEDLLQTTITHPAMLLYLDGATSTKAHPNENLGRELLELHTLGVGNYTEDDVKNAARILTGWNVDMWRTWAASYQTKDHWTGPVTVVGFSDPNASADGRAVTRGLLTYLAHHPATAQRLARKLAIKFVRDDPPQSLIDRLAQVYLDNDTAIVPVLRALIDSAEFKASIGMKTRDPGEDVVATYRALGVQLQAPTADSSAANATIWQADSLGLRPMAWPTPDGQPIDNTAWATPSRVLASMDMHWAMSGTWWPNQDLAYLSPTQWLPQRSLPFRDLVDHLSRTIHGRASTASTLKICSTAVSVLPVEVITPAHGLVKWGFPRLLAALLDHPNHYER